MNRVLSAIVVAVLCAVVLASTAGDYGLTWDEPVYVASADRLIAWFQQMGTQGARTTFSDENLQSHWVFATAENYNLPVPVLLSSAGHALSSRWVGPLISYRIGHCLFASATMGVLWFALTRRFGWRVAFVSVVSVFLMPRAFAHAHINATDYPVSCCWMLLLLAWIRGGGTWWGGILVGVVGGIGLATKASFLFVVPVCIAWMLLFRRWTWLKTACTASVIAPMVMLVLCPMWWWSPIVGPVTYFSTVFRGGGVWRINACYWGEVYNGSLPWHSGIVLPCITTPSWTLVLAVLGVAIWLFRRRGISDSTPAVDVSGTSSSTNSAALPGSVPRDPAIGIWILSAMAFPMLRFLPNTPGHDGIRLMLPSILSLGVLSGFGFASLSRWQLFAPRRWLHRLTMCVPVVGGISAIASMHPCEMSYYSEAIGGLAAAERRGFEVSYWFEGMNVESLREIQRQLPIGARVYTFPHYDGYELLRRWRLWRPDIAEVDLRHADYLLLYTRKASFYEVQGIEEFFVNTEPVWWFGRRGVPIVSLYFPAPALIEAPSK